MSLILGQMRRRRRMITGRAVRGLARRAVRGVARRPGRLARRRRARGISGAELRGFKKVARLLAGFGMRPRGLARPAARPRRLFGKRRVGDPEDFDE